jgi:hypothetical protein
MVPEYNARVGTTPWGEIELTSSARVKHRHAIGIEKFNQLTPNTGNSLIRDRQMMDGLR